MTLNGTLEDFSPAGILKVLSADGRTGAARFGGPHGCTVYLHRGQIYFARNEGTDEALATALVRPGRLTADDWGRAIDAAGDRPMVGEALVRDGAINPDLLASVVLSVIYDPLIDLFRDGTGEFDFEPDTVHWLGPFRAFPVDAIVGEVRKRVREVDEWGGTIPDLDVWVEARRTLPGRAAQVTILREDWELVTALSGHRTIRDLATELGRGAWSAARVVHRLHQAGLVEVVTTDANADIVPIRRPVVDEPAPEELTEDEAPVAGLETEADPLLAMGLPHRTPTEPAAEPTGDTVTAHIGDTTDEGVDAQGAATLTEVDHEHPDDLQPGAWDAPKAVAEADAAATGEGSTSLDNARPTDPNAAWLADLYSQFIDEPEAAAANGTNKKRRRGEPNPVDVAFRASEQDGEAKVSTLQRLMGALRKL